MSETKFLGNVVKLKGTFITPSVKAPDFTLVKGDLSNSSLKDYAGKFIVLNIFPSLDTSVCATSVRKFNELAAGKDNSIVLAVSKDLPFAQGRFCTAEGIENVIPLSDFRDSQFSEEYGVLMLDGPLAGLLARSVVVINPAGDVIYSELVPEITTEPNYDSALAAIK
jgi:thiol peroxidase